MSSTFSRADVERVARLARLELTDAEKDLFARQLAGILAYAEQVQGVDTNGIEPTSHALATAASWREDELTASLDRADAMSAAPEAAPGAGLFKVPRVLG
jgi:aspartyl-tRNA(Asn)/glutamyl-tRNA(Gln) amidotransferase subunit C